MSGGPGQGPKEEIEPKEDARAAFRYPAFMRFQTARFCIVIATEMQAVAVGWQVYEITKRPMDLGYVGLAQFLPGILLFLVSGHVADRFNRRNLLILCDFGFAICFALLLGITWRGNVSIVSVYAVLVLLGVVRSFNGPVSRAMLPHLVRAEHFASSVAWASSIFQAATILGPVLGGLIYAFARGPIAVYVGALIAASLAIVLTFQLPSQEKARAKPAANLSTVFEGFHYIWREKLILGAISLDLFAVLLGGAVALLPVYAREILNAGPWALGILRSAPGVGADRDRASAAKKSRGRDDALVRGGIRLGDHRLRTVAQLRALSGCIVSCRRDRHGQRNCARYTDSGSDAGRNARTGERRGYDIHRCFQ